MQITLGMKTNQKTSRVTGPYLCTGCNGLCICVCSCLGAQLARLHWCRFSVSPLEKWWREEKERKRRGHQFSSASATEPWSSGIHSWGLEEARKPGKQVHLYEPSVLVHTPFLHSSTLSLISSHSFISVRDDRREKSWMWVALR